MPSRPVGARTAKEDGQSTKDRDVRLYRTSVYLVLTSFDRVTTGTVLISTAPANLNINRLSPISSPVILSTSLRSSSSCPSTCTSSTENVSSRIP